MSSPLSLAEIRDYWTKQALEHGTSHAASWSDHWAMQLEIRQILRWLDDGDRILDVGCANGFSTLQLASQKAVDIRGIDFIPEMIDQARERAQALAARLRGEVTFDVGDITDLREPENHYDKLVVIRVVINLGTWERQERALRECARVLRQGGTLLLSEATIQGWKRLNDFRREWNLPDIPMPGFNQYLDEDRVQESLSDVLELVELVNFSSTYFVATRVLKPLLAQAPGTHVDPANPDMHWNNWVSQLPSYGDYGTQKLFVLRRK